MSTEAVELMVESLSSGGAALCSLGSVLQVVVQASLAVVIDEQSTAANIN